MKISKIRIKNFRKLRDCHINLSDKETLFVGSNNSGKTSAMHALMFFLGNEPSKFKFTDFPINNWEAINSIGESWIKENIDADILNSGKEWQEYCPCLQICLSNIKAQELPKIKHLIPDLSWELEHPLHICLFYEPKDINTLRIDFIKYISQIRALDYQGTELPLPNSLKEFLEKNINLYFSIKAYLVDSNDSSILSPLPSYPFKEVFKLSIIPAQRKFADSTEIDSRSSNLSEELSNFYNRHLNPKILPTQEDLNTLLNIKHLQDSLSLQLNDSFSEYINELKKLGYPSENYDPNIILESFIDNSEILKQNTKIKFGDKSSPLPEELNGLGYRNLIYIFFKLLSFKAEWQKVGKSIGADSETPAPIHLVLIEEPEAHLHSQVQQVFVKKAYEILTKDLQDENFFTTQMVISTHSSYIIHEIGFENLHYFKRCKEKENFHTEAIDLSNVFEKDNEKNKKFVSRYLRTIHCDLFFANAIILVEGSAERMLLPYFIRHHFQQLESSYISLLEVNGAHAHRFKPLIEALGVPCLVLTDLDSTYQQKKVIPLLNQGQESSCDNLTKWLNLANRTLDIVLDIPDNEKVVKNTFISYQKKIKIQWNNQEKIVIPYTFEDSIVFSNIQIFKDTEIMKGTTGMLKKMHKATLESNLNECCQKVFEALDGEKAKMALDILYEFEPQGNELFSPPNYINDGLEWLSQKLGLISKGY